MFLVAMCVFILLMAVWTPVFSLKNQLKITLMVFVFSSSSSEKETGKSLLINSTTRRVSNVFQFQSSSYIGHTAKIQTRHQQENWMHKLAKHFCLLRFCYYHTFGFGQGSICGPRECTKVAESVPPNVLFPSIEQNYYEWSECLPYSFAKLLGKYGKCSAVCDWL